MSLAQITEHPEVHIQFGIHGGEVSIDTTLSEDVADPVGLPWQRIGQQFVLNPAIGAHEQFLSATEIIEQIIGHARLEDGADEGVFPIHETLHGVAQRHLKLKPAQGIDLA